MAEFVAKAEEIARDAGALLREFYARGVAAEYKGDVDLVTEADRSSEKLISERLRAAFPSHGIFGEEGTRQALDSEYRWYIDPLDGTTNFAHGFPVFCVVLGCEHRRPGLAENQDGEMVVGVIYDPLRDEMFSTDRGAGATLNGKPMQVSKTSTLQESLIATGFPSHKRHRSPECPLLPGVHTPFAWCPPRRFSRAGPRVRCRRKAGRLLGVQPKPLGHLGWLPSCGRSRWLGDAFQRNEVHAGQQRGFCYEREDS